MRRSLYEPDYEHGSCGLGFVARADGQASHDIVGAGLRILRNLAHRGARGSDADTGDGAGILLQLPDAFLRAEASKRRTDLPPPGRYGAGMLFLSQDDDTRRECERALEEIAADEGQRVLFWRDVPVRPDAIGETARARMPRVRQVFIASSARDTDSFERSLYVIRRRLHHVIQGRYGNVEGCYVVSLSSRTLVYKGLLTGPQVPQFYPDLADPSLASGLALVHSRFSTNTLGSWQLAHPYRYIAHNGEINALRGNVNWMRAREAQLHSPLFGEAMERVRPVVDPDVSDSASFDNVFELLVQGGRSLPHAAMMMLPEAWENDDGMEPERRGFYDYHSAVMEPWDGPAAIAFTDGRSVGAALDRNGLRPARYSITRDGLVVLASEEGALPLLPGEIVVRSRLGPGEMLLVDTERGAVLGDAEIKNAVARRRPYRAWAERGTISLDTLPAPQPVPEDEGTALLERQLAFGYTFEELKMLLAPMAADGKEPDGSMGTDTPLAVLSERPQLLFSYFKQLFAQVTNPPIDPLREQVVMSLRTSLGPEGNLFDEGPELCRRILLESPILTGEQMSKLRPLTPSPSPTLGAGRSRRAGLQAGMDQGGPHSRGTAYPDGVVGDRAKALPYEDENGGSDDGTPFRTQTLSLLFPVQDGPQAMERALESLCTRAQQEVEAGTTILILSDRGVSRQHAAIPSLLALAAVHHHLVRSGRRIHVGLVVETGEAREVHHMALLVGYGATAIYPYVALEIVHALAESGRLPGVTDPSAAVRNYVAAIGKGLLKIISKMGISTLPSYSGAQIFEAVGLGGELVDRHFTGTASRIGGLGMEDLAREVLARHARAFPVTPQEAPALPEGGEYGLRPEGERHAWNTETIVMLQRATRTGDFSRFLEFADRIDEQDGEPATLRDLFDLARDPIPLDEVEPATEIVKRFSTGAMSFGSLSAEAHETLAIAMNRIGGKSNTGEGGEDEARFTPDPDGDSRRSAIKQIASGRFGVTAHYLVNADVLQIKMAQGSKPGEGGQLPAHKVSEDIARARHSLPGVGLISPPPHHDIYSIEDLAQLIYDLKHVNRAAQVSVKLVSAVGVGTIAAGVVKAKADLITISGYDGGTGASPLSSIKHAGLPWELGLAEAQQVLRQNDLRGRVRLQIDGQVKTGRDVAIAALLGADEVAFSTAPLIAAGCVMARVCHLNTCPVGIATQDPELRKKFAGTPDHVITYLFFVAEQLRRIMADLGFRRFEQMVGRSDKLVARALPPESKAARLDLSRLLARSDGRHGSLHHSTQQEHELDGTLDSALHDACRAAVETGTRLTLGTVDDPLPIRNTDRAVGAMLSSAIARLYGSAGLPANTISLLFRGTTGQSFGVWGMRGMTLVLQGEANDHVGKGLSGARLVITTPPGAAYEPERTVVAGNAALYGATSGEAYIRGLAGERFAVRNSGAYAVVEGVGDHGCEYMTGGAVLVLGPTGRNFAAGMSGGRAFVLDLWGRFADEASGRCNREMVGLERLEARDDVALVRRLLRRHVEWTGSPIAHRVLTHWTAYGPRFVKVMPHDLRRALEAERDTAGERAV